MKSTYAGESHGEALVAIIKNVPANMPLDVNEFTSEMKRRQATFGRSERQQFESDEVQIISGVRNGKTIGSAITLMVANKDTKERSRISNPRPGHADLVGIIKYDFDDIANVSEVSSARRSVLDVAVGVISKKVLKYLEIEVTSHVLTVNNSSDIKKEIIEAQQSGDTLGGEVKITIAGMPVGIGSYNNYEDKLDGILAQTIMSLNSVKGVLFGENPNCKGTQYLDEFSSSQSRLTNNQGGIEGGISNGQDININVLIKPIPTLYKPLKSFNIDTLELEEAHILRSDTCVVEAVGIILESVVANKLCELICEMLYSDTIDDLINSYEQLVQKQARFNNED